MDKIGTVNLFWTGGWDSTFQLLRLILIHRLRVKPFYLIDAKRPSTLKEIQTMDSIRTYVIGKYPYAVPLLEPIEYFDVTDIQPNSKITEAYHSILKKKHVGSQYEWLARFCMEKGISNMQLSVEKGLGDYPGHFLSEVDHMFVEKEVMGQVVHQISEKHADYDYKSLLGFFEFPLLDLTKSDMRGLAEKHKFSKVMELTWFCHNPIKNNIPCGICKPCLVALKEGFNWRIPYKRRLISQLYDSILWPAKSILRKSAVGIGVWKA